MVTRGEDGAATGVVALAVGLTVLAGWLAAALLSAGLTVGWLGLARVVLLGGRYGNTTALAGAEGDEEAGAVEDEEDGRELDGWAAGLTVLAVHPATVPRRIARAGRAAWRMSRVRDMLALNALSVLPCPVSDTKWYMSHVVSNRPILHCSAATWRGHAAGTKHHPASGNSRAERSKPQQRVPKTGHVVDQGNAISGNTPERCDLQYSAAPALWRVGRETGPYGGANMCPAHGTPGMSSSCTSKCKQFTRPTWGAPQLAPGSPRGIRRTLTSRFTARLSPGRLVPTSSSSNAIKSTAAVADGSRRAGRPYCACAGGARH
jgi:hypothetical protein